LVGDLSQYIRDSDIQQSDIFIEYSIEHITSFLWTI